MLQIFFSYTRIHLVSASILKNHLCTLTISGGGMGVTGFGPY